MIIEYIIGASFGALYLIAFWRTTDEKLALVGFFALACMLSIYIGAHLVTSGLPRILSESTFFTLVMALALYLKDRWPLGIGLLTIAHGGYDFLFGHSAGVAHWYPALCVGFDLIVGGGLVFRFSGLMDAGRRV